jgi:hypothetical protein
MKNFLTCTTFLFILAVLRNFYLSCYEGDYCTNGDQNKVHHITLQLTQ